MEKSLSTILSSFAGGPDELIPILQKVQHEFGFLSDSAMDEISEYTGVPASRIYAVATFYAQFRFTPIGRNHVTACKRTACHVRGAPRILDVIGTTLGITDGETTEDMEYSLETVACIGACGLSPCIMINRKVMAKMTPKKVAKLFSRSGKN